MTENIAANFYGHAFDRAAVLEKGALRILPTLRDNGLETVAVFDDRRNRLALEYCSELRCGAYSNERALKDLPRHG